MVLIDFAYKTTQKQKYYAMTVLTFLTFATVIQILLLRGNKTEMNLSMAIRQIKEMFPVMLVLLKNMYVAQEASLTRSVPS